ncbi:PAS domain-containing sensor histidine kinase [Desertivirga brevis]|uniref:PAS domain-containing sensor histidine kinase n=1 Tax=Desertivirga brevis TaxID=2810310 RepID=UPI001A96B585|nr:PAS domain S-box protein [Pedobacter sp. SYSU D00873]
MNDKTHFHSQTRSSRELESLLHLIDAVSGVGIYEVDLHTNTIYFSEGMYKIFGEDYNSFVPSLDWIDGRSNPDDAMIIRRILERAAIDKDPYFYTRRIKRKDGSWRTVESHGKVISDKGGNAIKFFGVVKDITEKEKGIDDTLERKEAEAANAKNLAILEQSEQVASIGSWEYDLSSRTTLWSKGMYVLFGITPGTEVSPQLYLDFVTEKDKLKAENLIDKITNKFVPIDEHIVIQTAERKKCLHIKAVPYSNEFGEKIKMLGVDIDISERKEAEAKLRQAEEEKQNAILNAVMETQEEERRRIAETLHNEFGQLLTATKFQIRGKAREAEKLLDSAIQLVRSISHELMPPILQDYGLEIALKDLFDSKLPESNIKYYVHITGLKKRINQMTEIAVFRIIQEIVNNIVKHSKATRVDAMIERRQEDIFFRISDNGIGVKETDLITKRKSFGLNYIYNRVHLLKGEIIFDSKPGKGCSLIVTIPYKEI